MPQHLRDFLVTARSLAEYVAMFDLDLPALVGRDVLDCPGGAASFTAEATALGIRATAVDPAYALAPGDLAVRALDDVRAGSDWVAAHSDAYVWTSFASPAQHAAARTAAAGRFAWDLRRSPERYVAAALPDLPVADGSVDLVLSSHLLFCYADRLDADFHRAALRELLRVVRPAGEVRVFPLVDYAGTRPPFLADLLEELRQQGVGSREVPVGTRFQRGADTMLVLRH